MPLYKIEPHKEDDSGNAFLQSLVAVLAIVFVGVPVAMILAMFLVAMAR